MSDAAVIPDDWMLEALARLDRSAMRRGFSYGQAAQLRSLLIQVCRLDDDAHEIVPAIGFLTPCLDAGFFDRPSVETGLDPILPGFLDALRTIVGALDLDALYLAMIRREVTASPDHVLGVLGILAKIAEPR